MRRRIGHRMQIPDGAECDIADLPGLCASQQRGLAVLPVCQLSMVSEAGKNNVLRHAV